MRQKITRANSYELAQQMQSGIDPVAAPARGKSFLQPAKISRRGQLLLQAKNSGGRRMQEFLLTSDSPPRPGGTKAKAFRKASHQMPMGSGRLEKRTPRAVPVRISSTQGPAVIERTTTENISPLGVRVVVSHHRQLNERLVVKNSDGDLQTEARVVYCQRLSDEQFAIGLQFPQATSAWIKNKLSYGD